jgi:hypothetical protein
MLRPACNAEALLPSKKVALSGKLCVPVTVSLLPVLTAAFLRRAWGNSGEADDAEPENLDSGP